MEMVAENTVPGVEVIDATGLHYRELNGRIREIASAGVSEIILEGVNGQRYIGDGLSGDLKITINGVPGNDLGAFMGGCVLVVNDNAQDGVANTMNDGKIIIRGNAGDVVGYGMRGGRVFVKGNVGYRVGIHMKSFKDRVPVVVAGGRAGDFFGEYMAGGVLVLVGMHDDGQPVAGNYLGTGMHGGAIYARGEVSDHQLGSEVREFPLEEDDRRLLGELLDEFAADTEVDLGGIGPDDFKKFAPFSHRPYGNLYVY